jgi:light-regulated signal transduction histidine kinase (bacteriophytochrome)
MGFDPQFKETIFVLFQRLHSKTDYPGTGIGLAICKKIVENHKGHITADSILEKGSVFTVFLPE